MMRFGDILDLTLRNINFRSARSWLTMLGIVIGIASVVGLITYGESMTSQANFQLSSLGANNIEISSGSPERANRTFGGQAPETVRGFNFFSFSSSETLTKEDLREISSLDYVEAASPTVSARVELKYQGEQASVQATFIIPSEFQKAANVDLSSGSFFYDGETGSIVLGSSVANEYFSEVLSVGDSVSINGKNFKVAGILETIGGMNSYDNVVLINIDIANNFIDSWSKNYESITVTALDSQYVDTLSTEISSLLMKLHDVKQGEEDFRVTTYQSMMSSIGSIADTLVLFLAGIASISLIVGVMSISSTMYTSVYEKIREIGIMRAIGAEDSDIMALFMCESVVMSLIGGLIGIFLGLAFSWVLAVAMPSMMPRGGSVASISINPTLMASSLLLSMLIGVVSGYFPARKAARLDPIKAIAYE
jgi:putative ABC transport system permease protein